MLNVDTAFYKKINSFAHREILLKTIKKNYNNSKYREIYPITIKTDSDMFHFMTTFKLIFNNNIDMNNLIDISDFLSLIKNIYDTIYDSYNNRDSLLLEYLELDPNRYSIDRYHLLSKKKLHPMANIIATDAHNCSNIAMIVGTFSPKSDNINTIYPVGAGYIHLFLYYNKNSAHISYDFSAAKHEGGNNSGSIKCNLDEVINTYSEIFNKYNLSKFLETLWFRIPRYYLKEDLIIIKDNSDNTDIMFRDAFIKNGFKQVYKMHYYLNNSKINIETNSMEKALVEFNYYSPDFYYCKEGENKNDD